MQKSVALDRLHFGQELVVRGTDSHGREDECYAHLANELGNERKPDDIAFLSGDLLLGSHAVIDDLEDKLSRESDKVGPRVDGRNGKKLVWFSDTSVANAYAGRVRVGVHRNRGRLRRGEEFVAGDRLSGGR